MVIIFWIIIIYYFPGGWMKFSCAAWHFPSPIQWSEDYKCKIICEACLWSSFFAPLNASPPPPCMDASVPNFLNFSDHWNWWPSLIIRKYLGNDICLMLMSRLVCAGDWSILSCRTPTRDFSFNCCNVGIYALAILIYTINCHSRAITFSTFQALFGSWFNQFWLVLFLYEL